MRNTVVFESLEASIKLRFRRAEDHTADALGLPSHREACVRPSHNEVCPSGRSLSLGAPSEIGVGVQMRRNVARLITYPTYKAEVERRVDV